MKKVLIVIVLLIFFSDSMLCQFRFDTVSTSSVGPGMRYTRVVEYTSPLSLHVLEIDLKNPYVSVKSVKAGDRLRAFEKPSSMAARKTSIGRTVIGAVNADFYDTGTGIPINVQVADGEILRRPISTSTIGFDTLNNPMLKIVAFSGSVKISDSARIMNGINETRNTNYMVLYNSFMGTGTGTNQWGTEILLTPLTNWAVNDTIPCIVDSISVGVGNMGIPKGKAILSGHGTAKTYLDLCVHKGDIVKIYIGLTPALPKLTQLVGGYCRIVNNGVNCVDQSFAQEGGPSHTYEYHPRTCAGFSADSSKLYFVVVDGRQPAISAGMTLKQLADFMIQIGAAHAVNFDGGGSTAMVVRGSVMNSPSDGVERSVANALMVLSSAPQGPFHHIEVNPRRLKVFTGDQLQFNYQGVDQYGNPAPFDSTKLTFSVDARLGTITNKGLFVAVTKRDSGYIIFSYDGWRDSSFVMIQSVARITITPQNVVTDTTRNVAFGIAAYDQDNVKRTPLAGILQWSVANTFIGMIDNAGNFQGKKAGTTYVVARYEQAIDSTAISVVIGKGTVLVDSIESIGGWTVNKTNIDSATLSLSTEMHTLGTHSFRLDYSFVASTTSSYLYLDTSIPLSGVPDTIIADVQPDSTWYRLYYIVQDENGEAFRLSTASAINKPNEIATVKIGTASASPLIAGSMFFYPITLKRIEVQVYSIGKTIGNRYRGKFYIDNLRIRYPQGSSAVGKTEEVPRGIVLSQNYPNPFNPSTTIRYSLTTCARVKLTIHDILGREIATLVSEEQSAGWKEVQWNAKDVASGIYFYKLTTGSFVETKKLMLLK
jgi:hypothetical protein